MGVAVFNGDSFFQGLQTAAPLCRKLVSLGCRGLYPRFIFSG